MYEFLRTGWFQYGGMSRKVLTPFGSGERLSSPLLPLELGISAFCRHVAVQIRRCHRPPESERERRRAEVGLLAVRHSERRHPPPALPLEVMAQEAAAGCLAHGLRLGSVYEHRTATGDEVTTKQRRWLTVDYIFHRWVAAVLENWVWVVLAGVGRRIGVDRCFQCTVVPWLMVSPVNAVLMIIFAFLILPWWCVGFLVSAK